MQDRRRHERATVNAPARILDRSNLLTRCELRDISQSGVGIRLDPAIPLSGPFRLFGRNLERRCRPVWLADGRLGAEFGARSKHRAKGEEDVRGLERPAGIEPAQERGTACSAIELQPRGQSLRQGAHGATQS
jgi:hypothetical protein